MSYLKHYKKRTFKNKVKYHIQKTTTLILSFTAMLFILNSSINWLSNYQGFVTETKHILEISSVEAEVSPQVGQAVEAQVETVGQVNGSEKSLTSIENLIASYFPDNTEDAIRVFQAESGLNPDCPSVTDITKDGYVYSYGLAQINLTVSNIGGVDCSKAFKGRNNNAIVVDKALYNQCVKLAKDPDLNLDCAQKKFQGRGNWSSWGVVNNGTVKI